MEYASKGVAGTGLGLGIAGTALGVLGNGLGNIFNANPAGTCHENTHVNRYELAQEQKIADLQSQTKPSVIGCMQGQIAQLYSLTKLVVPNASVCPGWGNVTITPATTPTTAG